MNKTQKLVHYNQEMLIMVQSTLGFDVEFEAVTYDDGLENICFVYIDEGYVHYGIPIDSFYVVEVNEAGLVQRELTDIIVQTKGV